MIQAIKLRCEYMVNPIGIDIVKPLLTWNVEGAAAQSAYELKTWKNGKIEESSKKTQSSSMHCIYNGSAGSRDIIEWCIRLYDENGVCGEWSQKQSFEIGLLRKEDWKAGWISGGYTPKKTERYSVDCFRKKFQAQENKLQKARLYISAFGLYEAKLNGHRIGTFILAPGSTDYRKRVQYQVYDVLSLLQSGTNEFTLELADGWYRGANGAFGNTCVYGIQTKFIAQLELTDQNGRTTVIGSDGTFDWSNDGSIVFADLKDGEIIHAGNTPSYTRKSREVEWGTALLTASNNVSVTEHETFQGELIKTPDGKTVIDFKQNIAGYVTFSLKAKAGQRVFLRYGEMLDENGNFTQKNIQLIRKKIGATPLQQTEYICKEGINKYKPKFAIAGFRYMLIETEVSFAAEDFTAVAVYSDLEYTCRFDSSNELLNKFVKATEWSVKGNTADVPTDCPTRERAGWTGDAQIFFCTAAYMTAYAPFGRKFIRDMTDRETKNGIVHQIVPWVGEPKYMSRMDGSIGWACAIVLIPYHYYKMYKDKRILEENYDAMSRYAHFMIRRTGKMGIFARPLGLSGKVGKYAVNCGQSFGEWSEPTDINAFHISDFIAPHPEESTAYTHFTLKHMAEIAEILDKKEDASFFKEYSDGARTAYQELVEKKAYSLDTDRQAKLVRPLFMGLLNTKQRKYARERLLKALDNYDWRLGTGFLSTPFILYVLEDIDTELAYRLLENEKCPGWLHMPLNGATTVWESWEGFDSRNHYSKGAVCEWLFTRMCGIQIIEENKFRIAPKPGGQFTFARTEFDSIYGKVSCGWHKQENGYELEIGLPSNTMATVSLPGREDMVIGSGNHKFILDNRFTSVVANHSLAEG